VSDRRHRWRIVVDRLGSRWCCSWQVAVAMIVLGLLVTTGWGSGQATRSVGHYILIELLADGAAAVVFIIAAVTVMRPRPQRPVAVPVVVGVWALIGLMRALVLDRFYVEGIVQIVSATVTLTAWALLIIYVAATLSDERERATRLREANAELLIVRDSVEDLLESERARLVEAVRESVSPEISRLRQLVTVLDRPSSTSEISALADRVAAYSTDVVRQASRDIRVDDAVPRPLLIASADGTQLPTVIQSYARVSQPILVPMALITLRALSVWASQDDLLAAALGLVGLVVVTGVGWLLRSAIDRLVRRPSLGELVVSSALVVAMSASLMLIFVWARGGASGPTYVPLPLIVTVVLAVLVAARLVVALDLRWRLQVAEWERVNDELETANQKLADEVHVVRDQLAGILHGPVQGRLAAASMALRMYVAARESGQQPDLNATVATATTLLDRAQTDIEQLGRGATEEVVSLEQGIERIAQNWSGLLSVEYQIEDPWPRPPDFTMDCIDLISELVTNASRHGDARSVSIRVDGVDAHGRVIEAIDDGSGPAGVVMAGQGLAGVRRWSGEWAVALAESGGARVTLTLHH
jgi:signal transduction histidine kinase